MISFGYMIQSKDTNIKISLGLLSFILFCFLIVRIIIEMYKSPKNSLITDEFGFEFEGKRMLWNDMVDYRIIRMRGQYKSFDLIIGTISGGVEKFNLFYTVITVDQLLEILNLNRKDYFTRFERNLPEII
jgi:hypothetical protein